jgi:hypothetical protein
VAFFIGVKKGGDEKNGKEEGIRSSNNCFLDNSWNSSDHTAKIFTFSMIRGIS